MNKINYQKELDKELEDIKKRGDIPSLLLHVCCAPCSSYVLEYLSEYFNITVLFYNPNISEDKEYMHRAKELIRFIEEKEFKNPVEYIIEEYSPDEFYNKVKGYEACREGGSRCFICYRLRMERTAKMAQEKQFDYFTTTLSISPLKNAQKLNEIGAELEQEYKTKYLYSDFKKKNGYKRSIELSKEYNLYRQNFCGCVFSIRKDSGE